MKSRNRIFIVMICIFILWGNTAKVQAATNSSENQNASNSVVIVKNQLVITISYGFSQEARYGRFVGFTIDIYNKGESFGGTIKATLLNNEQENITYAKENIFTGGEKTQVTMQLPMNQYTQEVNFSFKDFEGKTIVEEIIPMNIKNYGDNCLIGILSDDPITLRYLQYFGAKVIDLDKNNLPSDYLSYDMLDTIVVDHFELDSLESSQIECLINFVERGGNLVLGVNVDNQSNIELLEQYKVVTTEDKISYADEDNEKMKFNLYSEDEFTKMLTKIRDYESSRNSLLQEIENSKQTIPNAGENTYIGRSMLGSNSVTDLKQQESWKKVTRFSLANAENVIEKDGIRLYEQVSYGHGIIMVFHFCLQNRNITEEKINLYEGCSDSLFSSFYAEVANQIKQSLSETTISRLNNEISGEVVDYRIQEMSDFSEIANVPKVGKYIVALLIYILIVGPISFFVLWKLKKQSKVWFVIPSISVIFFIIVYLLGTTTRVKKPYVGYLNIEYYDDSLYNVQGTTYALLGLNEKSPATIHLNTADAIVMGDSQYESYYDGIYNEKITERKFYDYTDANLSVLYQNDGIEIQFKDKAAFHAELVRGIYHKAYQPVVNGNLNLTKDSLEGTITNESKQTLNNALLYLCGYYVNLGTLKPSESVNLSDCSSIYMGNIDSLLYTENDISKSWGINIDKMSTVHMRKIDAYSYAFEYYIPNKEEPYIVASVDGISTESPFYEIEKEDESYGESLIVAKLSINSGDSKESIVPNIDKYLRDSSTYIWDEKTRFSYISSIEFTYDIPRSEHITELYLSDLFNHYDNEEYENNRCGRIYLYNYSTQQFELVFDLYSKYGTRSIQNAELDRFINENNQIMIRYENGNTNSEVFEVPIISCRKETIDANN